MVNTPNDKSPEVPVLTEVVQLGGTSFSAGGIIRQAEKIREVTVTDTIAKDNAGYSSKSYELNEMEIKIKKLEGEIRLLIKVCNTLFAALTSKIEIDFKKD